MSKAAAEGYVEYYARDRGLSAFVLRLANVYGPRQDPRGEAGVIAMFCAAAVDGRVPTVFGDGGQTRDFVYVGDVVDAFCAAGESRCAGFCNVATGRETTIAALAQALGLRPRVGAGAARARSGAPASHPDWRRSCWAGTRARRWPTGSRRPSPARLARRSSGS